MGEIQPAGGLGGSVQSLRQSCSHESATGAFGSCGTRLVDAAAQPCGGSQGEGERAFEKETCLVSTAVQPGVGPRLDVEQVSEGGTCEDAAVQPCGGSVSFSIPAGAPVLLCSGQGAQRPGMGADLMGVPEVADVFECASDVLGFDVAELVLHADPDTLNDTRNAQPALCVLTVALGRALMARGVEPAAVLGFSLGQVSALALSGMLSDEETFALVKERAALMADAAAEHPGAMSALLKADEESVVALCEECAQGEVLVPANFNCPGQIVIAGTPAAVERAETAWVAAGKRCSRLATSGAFHSPLMASAAEGMADYLAHVEFAEARIPLICNVTAAPLAADEAREHLVQHLTKPVRFQQSVEALAAAGADTFVEVGFGGVLSNLVKRIDKTATRTCVQDRASFDAFLSEFE